MTDKSSDLKPVIWLLVDDRAGNRSQCAGVADALDLPFVMKEIRYTPLAKLPGHVLRGSLWGLTSDSRDQLSPPWPDLVIAAGRRTAPVALHLKKRSGGMTKLVHLMWPGAFASDQFDLICVPNHDDVPDLDNVLRTTGAPGPLDRVQDAKRKLEMPHNFAALPGPRIAVLCGGSTKNKQFTDTMAAGLGRATSTMALGAGGSLLVTTSRRTGEAVDALLEEIHAPAIIHRWDDGTENPYRDFLQFADAFVVTGESISMISEACSTGRPVYIYAPTGLATEKHARFHKELYELGLARPLGTAFERWRYPPLNVAADIASAIREKVL